MYIDSTLYIGTACFVVLPTLADPDDKDQGAEVHHGKMPPDDTHTSAIRTPVPTIGYLRYNLQSSLPRSQTQP